MRYAEVFEISKQTAYEALIDAEANLFELVALLLWI